MQKYRAWNSAGDELPMVHAETQRAACWIAATRAITAILNQHHDIFEVNTILHDDRVAVMIPTFGTVEFYAELA